MNPVLMLYIRFFTLSLDDSWSIEWLKFCKFVISTLLKYFHYSVCTILAFLHIRLADICHQEPLTNLAATLYAVMIRQMKTCKLKQEISLLSLCFSPHLKNVKSKKKDRNAKFLGLLHLEKGQIRWIRSILFWLLRPGVAWQLIVQCASFG